MSNRLRWTAWHLTPDGWFRSPTVENLDEIAQDPPAGALLAMVSVYRIDDPARKPNVSVEFRSTDENAVRMALEKHGVNPRNLWPKFDVGHLECPRSAMVFSL